MSRFIPLLSLGCLTAIGITTYNMLYGSEGEHISVPHGIPTSTSTTHNTKASKSGDDDLVTAMLTARRSCSTEALDSIIEKLKQRVAKQPNERDSWRRLAEARLHRVLQHGHLLGIRPGRPVYDELPKAIGADLDAAQKAIGRARELGDNSGDLFRISAEIMSQRITGLASALTWNGKIQEAIAKAGERIKNDPQLHLVLGLRKLMAPEFLGHDPDKALEHFRYAAEALPDDERPAVFAAMASYLKKKRLKAIAWLEKAVQRNPRNVFARVVLKRVRRGEEDPFGRDVTTVEAASGK